MGQDMLEMNYGSEAVPRSEVRSRQPRPLTYDESKAAEAAFQGQPFNPSWSAAAELVYEGIRAALAKNDRVTEGRRGPQQLDAYHPSAAPL